MSDRLCDGCAKPIRDTGVYPIRCSCGASYGQRTVPRINPRRRRALDCIAICESNRCGHWGDHEEKGRTVTGCGLLLGHEKHSPCKTFDYILDGGGCLSDDPRFKPAPGRPAISQLEPEPVPPRDSDRLVIAVVVGRNAEQQFAITGPRMAAYAKACGADFRVIRGDKFAGQGWPMGNKWRIRNYVAKYARTLYLDVDVLVRADAPSIFDDVPTERIALYDEFGETIDNVPDHWIQRESDRISDLMGWEHSQRTWSANGGVMLFPRWAADLYAPPAKPFPKMWCLDQGLLTQTIDRWGITPYLLGRRWNHGFVGPEFFEGLENAHFIHLNGSRPHSYRMRLLRRIAAGIFDPLHPPPGNEWRPQWAR